jgi:hypothetical protein
MNKQPDTFERWVTWPDWAKDAIVVDTDVRLSWRDALRVLFRRRFTMSAKVFVPAVVERHEGVGHFSVEPIWPRRKGYGVAEAEAKP